VDISVQLIDLSPKRLDERHYRPRITNIPQRHPGGPAEPLFLIPERLDERHYRPRITNIPQRIRGVRIAFL
jgi:hypothetical protein